MSRWEHDAILAQRCTRCGAIRNKMATSPRLRGKLQPRPGVFTQPRSNAYGRLLARSSGSYHPRAVVQRPSQAAAKPFDLGTLLGTFSTKLGKIIWWPKNIYRVNPKQNGDNIRIGKYRCWPSPEYGINIIYLIYSFCLGRFSCPRIYEYPVSFFDNRIPKPK